MGRGFDDGVSAKGVEVSDLAIYIDLIRASWELVSAEGFVVKHDLFYLI